MSLLPPPDPHDRIDAVDPPPPPDAPRSRVPVLLGCLGLASLVLLAGGVLSVVRSGDDGPDHPDAWDPRVADLAAFVEDERGLSFEHPVHVDFLSEDAFRDDLTTPEDDLTDEDREYIEHATGLLRALGLVEGDVDLFSVTNELYGGGVAGLYDYETERISVRGDELTPMIRSTLVHELTHVLQDQHFDLDRDFGDDDEAASAFQAIVEGDADRIELAYEADLPEDEVEALADEEAAAAEEAEGDLDAVPDFLVASFGAPYALGDAFLTMYVETDGEEAIDDLFDADRTVSMEHLFDPWTFSDGDEVVDVAIPDLDDGEELTDDGPFGLLGWYFMLASRLDTHEALAAVDGWGGDAYVSFERDGQACVRIDYVGDSRQQTGQMHRALRDWVDSMPDGTASVEERGDGLRFESCDPGPEAEERSPTGASDALTLAASRTYITATLLAEGAPEDFARCYVAEVIAGFTLEELSDPEGLAFTGPDGQEKLALMAAGC
jgi:hypothetical protein